MANTEETTIPHENRLVLMPVKPGTFFVLWDFSKVREKRIKDKEFSSEIKICLFNEKGIKCYESKFPWNMRRAYIHHESKPGKYYAVLYLEAHEGWIILSESNKSLSPAVSKNVNGHFRAGIELLYGRTEK